MYNLIQKIKEYSLEINKNGAKEESRMLNEYAIKLADKRQSSDTLKEFYQFTQHYKGMRDMIVPNYSEKEWTTITKDLEKHSKLAMIEHGLLKKSFFTRILDFIFFNKHN